MKKSEAITKILGSLEKSETITKILGNLNRLTMETTNSDDDNNSGLIMTGNDNNNNNKNHSGSTTISPSKPRPETPISIKSKSSVNCGTTSSREGSDKEESSKLSSSKRSTNVNLASASSSSPECGALMDCKLTKVNSSLDTINLSVCHLASEFQSLKMLMETQEKMHRITFAIENCEFGSFEYYNSLTFCHHQSHHLVKSILFAFRQEDGYELPTECIVEESLGDRCHHAAEEKKMANGERLFHESLVTQIHALTGVEPRIEKIAGNDIIWYS